MEVGRIGETVAAWWCSMTAPTASRLRPVPFRWFVVPALFLSVLGVSPAPAGQLSPNVLFGDHAVLQRDKPVTVWGKAQPGSSVRVSFKEKSAQAVADDRGRWQMTLPALPGGESGELIFESGDERVVSKDVIVGDVWLCTGQSNMEWTVKKSDNATAEIAAGNFPEIRQFKVLTGVSARPEESVRGKWVVCSPETVGDFTALGYFMARNLLKVTGQPQGLINASWGGTAIETWLSQDAIAADPALAVIQERWDKVVAAYPAAKAKFDRTMAEWEEKKKAAAREGKEFTQPKPKAPEGGPKSRGVSGAYNAMIHPLAPYTVRAAIWYQGEANWKYPTQYGGLLKALIKDWRVKWNDAELPFVIVQLPAYGGEGNVCWPYIREGQAGAVTSLPPAGLLVTVDLGEAKEIHPPNKQVFGERLARTVRRTVFGEDLDDQGPVILSATPEGSAMRVRVEEKGRIVLREQPPVLGAFELAGADRVFHPATARLEGRDLIVSSPAVPAPVALRYAWREFPKPCLFDDQGLPAAPFRTDDWPPKK